MPVKVISLKDIAPDEKGNKPTGSCRLCAERIGTYQIINEDKKEIYFLCDEHVKTFNVEKDILRDHAQ